MTEAAVASPRTAATERGARWPLPVPLAATVLVVILMAVVHMSRSTGATVPLDGPQAVAAAAASSNAEAPVPEPVALPVARAPLKPATRDPFAHAAAGQVPAPAAQPAPSPESSAVLATPVMPSEPVLQLSFTGRMQTPEGRTVVLAQWSDGRSVTLEQGKVLSNGYRVERMDAGMVELLNPQTQAVVQLPLPPAPRFETR